MESPSKRLRLSSSSDEAEPEPEPEPQTESESESQTEETDADLEDARTQNDLRLKSIFEGIFEKYGKDFTDVGDEIDLSTGKIVVNNGHVSNMRAENDVSGAGAGADGDGDGDGSGSIGIEEGWPFSSISTVTLPLSSEDDWSTTGAGLPGVSDDLDCRNRDGKGHGERVIDNTVGGLRSMFLSNSRSFESGLHSNGGDYDGDYDDDDDDKSSVDSLLDTALSIGNGNGNGNGNSKGNDKGQRNTTTTTSKKPSSSRDVSQIQSIDPLWQAPDIPTTGQPTPTRRVIPKPRISSKSVSNTAVRFASPPGSRSIWSLPQPNGSQSKKSPAGTGGKQKKKTDSPSHQKQKKKRPPTGYSSPVIRNWKFAEIPDGNESDDPLQ